MYAVALDEDHFAELVTAHSPPPPALASSTAASLVRSFARSDVMFRVRVNAMPDLLPGRSAAPVGCVTRPCDGAFMWRRRRAQAQCAVLYYGGKSPTLIFLPGVFM